MWWGRALCAESLEWPKSTEERVAREPSRALEEWESTASLTSELELRERVLRVWGWRDVDLLEDEIAAEAAVVAVVEVVWDDDDDGVWDDDVVWVWGGV